jgi:uncharacterized protein (TIGR02598 family)
MLLPAKTVTLNGFSLVEITMALGLVSCFVLVILGLLPVGLRTIQDSAVQYGTANIGQQVVSELQRMPFSPSSDNKNYAITVLDGRTDYFSREGVKMSKAEESFFTVQYSLDDPSVPGATATYHSNLQMVRATIHLSQNSQPINVLSFLIAKQSSL